ncbi:Methylphosphotriester-DNA--protein-cysteine S-methyltransferase [Serratia quinivorans]|uniref:helix-turn-helix domain-containing protein n=1 Tax=Serratia quinivorans TaxID=137545 RepID=UPI00217808E9|nr:AraC family transcriptional regulator [Serratia quinivorans]CAI1906316.1 Methylphosphotriester-DNA--protein-cysteine S-methyltransferase [Serratia quinivorans]
MNSMENYGLICNDEAKPIISTKEWTHGLVQEITVDAPYSASLTRDSHTLILSEGFTTQTTPPMVTTDMWFDRSHIKVERVTSQLLYIVPKGCEFSAICHHQGRLHYTLIAIDPQLIAYLSGSNHPQCSLSSAVNIRNEFVFKLGEQLRDSDDELYSSALMATLLTKISRSKRITLIDPRAGKSISTEKKKLLTEYISDNLEKKISLHDLSTLVGISTSHFTREFKTCFGLSAYQYILERRMEKARNLLIRTRLPLSEIAILCGFSSQSQFSTMFARSNQIAPLQYRQLNKISSL